MPSYTTVFAVSMNGQLLQALSRLPTIPSIRTSTRLNFFARVLLALSCFFVASLPLYAEQPSLNSHSTASQKLAELPLDDCLAQLDLTVALAEAEADENQYLDRRFAELETRCPDLPHLAHNRGVLAAKASRWSEAVSHLNRSLSLDTRASMTHRHLQQIYEHRAAQAYALALNTKVSVKTPVLSFQVSTVQNADISISTIEEQRLQSISTVEYEMYAWWQALQSASGLDEFYTDSFPKAAIGQATRRIKSNDWADIRREIAFTENDAVVVLSDSQQSRTLLLLRLVATRWKIYQETAL